MNFDEFKSLASTHKIVTITETMLADMLTPVSAYMRLRRNAETSFLFESVEGDEKIARYSFLGRSPTFTIRNKNFETRISNHNSERILHDNYFDILSNLIAQYNISRTPNTSRFAGGFVGYFGYDIIRNIEKVPNKNPNDITADETILGFFPTVLIFDHLKHQIIFLSNIFIDDNLSLELQYDTAMNEIAMLKNDLIQSEFRLENFSANLSDLRSNTTQTEFEANVLKAKSYIGAGDIFQVVLSQRFEIPYSGDDFNVYRALRVVNPSPYLYYLDFGDCRVIGSSPEILVRKENDFAEVYPIAGTRKRGKNEQEDKQLENDLLNDEKELAEHIMLVDLGRNDLGKICKPGTVKVDELMKIVRYSHVMHIASRVSGIIEENKTAIDILKAAFPAGTVSGAPKIRAMEIIDELENVQRGIYAGGIGYIDLSGNLDTCIAIRTIFAKNGFLYFQSGAGIVADSIPANEYQETLHKSEAIVEAIKLAKGLK